MALCIEGAKWCGNTSHKNQQLRVGFNHLFGAADFSFLRKCACFNHLFTTYLPQILQKSAQNRLKLLEAKFPQIAYYWGLQQSALSYHKFGTSFESRTGHLFDSSQIALIRCLRVFFFRLFCPNHCAATEIWLGKYVHGRALTLFVYAFWAPEKGSS